MENVLLKSSWVPFPAFKIKRKKGEDGGITGKKGGTYRI